MTYVIFGELETPLEKSFTFQQNCSSGIINRRIAYTSFSNKLQEFSDKSIIHPVFKTKDSSISVIISNNN